MTAFAVAVRIKETRRPVYLAPALRWTGLAYEAHVFANRVDADRAVAWATSRYPDVSFGVEVIEDMDEFLARPEVKW